MLLFNELDHRKLISSSSSQEQVYVLGQVVWELIAVYNVLFTSLAVRGNSTIYCTYENNDCTDVTQTVIMLLTRVSCHVSCICAFVSGKDVSSAPDKGMSS
jgi:hypothetical protein